MPGIIVKLDLKRQPFMQNLNDIVLQIHMTFLNHKESIEWISSFENEISPLNEKEFEDLINMLEGVAHQEQANFMESIHHNKIPMHLQVKALEAPSFHDLIEQLKHERKHWKSKS